MDFQLNSSGRIMPSCKKSWCSFKHLKYKPTISSHQAWELSNSCKRRISLAMCEHLLTATKLTHQPMTNSNSCQARQLGTQAQIHRVSKLMEVSRTKSASSRTRRILTRNYQELRRISLTSKVTRQANPRYPTCLKMAQTSLALHFNRLVPGLQKWTTRNLIWMARSEAPLH